MSESRKQRIVAGLRTYTLALEDRAEGAWETSGKGDSKLLLQGPLWHHDCPKDCPRPGRRCQSFYAKLEACLAVLRRERPDLYWHVVHRYVKCDRRPREFVKRGNHYSGLPKPAEVVPGSIVVNPGDGFWKREQAERKITVRALVETWDPAVSMAKVDEGVEWLARVFPGDPTLPRPIYEQLAA